ncbi:MAG: hypothetical protein H0V07_05990 [Propionibacteriales bacterium]|nr:hypothetical protein [Propionibacteriales bacterium]
MSEFLGDLLRRSADAVPGPRLDVGELVAHAGRRQRRRRLAVVASTTALVSAIVVGSFAVRGGEPRHLEPAPSPSPSPSVVDPPPRVARPLVYAAGKIVHVGDDTFEAGANVLFVDATDDGVVFVTEDSDRLWYSDTLWFNDGSTTEAIGRVPTEHIGIFEVHTTNPGSLVVWADATSRTNESSDRFVVYDTSRHEVVARLPFTGVYNVVLHVDEGHIFFNPDKDTPGCWVYDIHYCKDPHLLRYDLASGETRKISQASFEAELRSRARMLVLAEARGDTGTVFTAGAMARFNQVGSRLVPVDSNGDPTVVRLTTGEPVALRVPAGYTSPGGEMSVVQWITDDRLVLFPNEGGDLPAKAGDLLVCTLPDGLCRVAVHASSTPYVAPG